MFRKNSCRLLAAAFVAAMLPTTTWGQETLITDVDYSAHSEIAENRALRAKRTLLAVSSARGAAKLVLGRVTSKHSF